MNQFFRIRSNLTNSSNGVIFSIAHLVGISYHCKNQVLIKKLTNSGGIHEMHIKGEMSDVVLQIESQKHLAILTLYDNDLEGMEDLNFVNQPDLVDASCIDLRKKGKPSDERSTLLNLYFEGNYDEEIEQILDYEESKCLIEAYNDRAEKELPLVDYLKKGERERIPLHIHNAIRLSVKDFADYLYKDGREPSITEAIQSIITTLYPELFRVMTKEEWDQFNDRL